MVDRGSLSRASLGRGSLGRFSVATDVSASSAATRHWVNSVSDIYGQDEIEELLQDLNRLELATLDTDKFQVRFNSQRGMLRRLTVQEFDIDGSHVGGVGLELPPSPGLPASSPLLPRPRSPGAVSRWPLKYPSNFELCHPLDIQVLCRHFYLEILVPCCHLERSCQPFLGQPHPLSAVPGAPR